MKINLQLIYLNAFLFSMPKKPIRTGVVAKAALAHLAALLRVRRKEKSLTLEELAVRLGITIPTVRRMLEGSPSVAIGTYFEAAHILGVPLFDPEQERFTATAAKTEKLDSVLPQRVRSRQVEIDDDF
ncbi:MAG: helix-turn-helix transcriptional regulator [Akkermansiaceae bacterium]|nr:helix-turn-helix transcriptional regulator [Akkermansiaceae bacterium]